MKIQLSFEWSHTIEFDPQAQKLIPCVSLLGSVVTYQLVLKLIKPLKTLKYGLN